MKKHLLSLGLLLLNIFVCAAQTNKLNGVYVGAELYNTPFNGMQIDNIVIYFRDNGTFNNALDQADWKTRVSGTYAIKNGMVQLAFKNGDESKKYKLAANGNLESTVGIKHTLHKVKKVTNLPPAVYEKKSASTSGGMGTPVVGAFSSDYLYFDGKGNFSTDRESVVGVSGDAAGGTVGGKFENKDNTSGTYKLGDGEITLTYSSGTKATHSFFYSPPNEEDLILMDGEFYFRDEDNKKPVATKQRQTAKIKEPNSTADANSALPAAAVVLSKLRSKYGGEGIDKLSTVKETATVNGNLQITAITDIPNNKIRAEVRQNGKLILVKQVDGNEGWQWMNGTKKPLSSEEKDELEISLYQGIIGLHKKFNGGMHSATVTASGNDYIVTFYHNKHKVVYLIGNDFTMKGNAYTITATPNISVYKNFTAKNGITYPAITESSDGTTKLTSTTTSIEFNPTLSSLSWQEP